MKLHAIITLLLLLISGVSFNQNLIPNPGFEDYSICPNRENQVHRLLHWFNPAPVWGGTPDYFNACSTDTIVDVPDNFSGHQTPRTGNGYCGMILFNYNLNVNYNYHEFLEVRLLSPLQKDSCYLFDMYVSLSEHSHPATDDIGVYLSDTIIAGVTNYYPLPFTPQIVNQEGIIKERTGWMQISGEYQAHGGEEYLIIGNFTSDSMTNYIITPGCCWEVAYVLIDDVSLRPEGCLTSGAKEVNHTLDFKVFPNPVSRDTKILIESGYDKSITIEIYDMLGCRLGRADLNGSNEFDLTPLGLNSGTYLIKVSSKGIATRSRLIVVL